MSAAMVGASALAGSEEPREGRAVGEMTENIEPTINVIGYMIRAIAGGARRFALLCAGETLREEVAMVVDRLIGCP
jgi:hypothetical protein